MRKEAIDGLNTCPSEVGLPDPLVFGDKWSVLTGRDAVSGDPCRGRAACHGDPCRGRAACGGDPGNHGHYHESADLYLQAFGYIPSVHLSVDDLLKARITALQR